MTLYNSRGGFYGQNTGKNIFSTGISRGAAESAALRMDTADPGSLFVPEKIQGGTAQEEKIHCGTGRSFSVVTWYLRLRPGIRPCG